jgi:hypothetical protein
MASIAEKSQNVRHRLLDLVSLASKGQQESPAAPIVQPAAVTDVLERFMLWAGNLGALRNASTKLSLDHRLAGAPEICNQICRQLDEIVEAVDECKLMLAVISTTILAPILITLVMIGFVVLPLLYSFLLSSSSHSL